MSKLKLGRLSRKLSLVGRLNLCAIATCGVILAQASDARAWYMNNDGIFNEQGNWVPGAVSVWPEDMYGIHYISVCWEAPTQAQIDSIYPGQGIAAASQSEAATWMQLARRYVENTWQRASNIVFTGWGPCTYNLYNEYPGYFGQRSDTRCPDAAHCGYPESFSLALLPLNGQRVHPERNGLHVEVISGGTSWFAPYRGKNGITLGRLTLRSNITHPWQDVHEFGHALGWVHEENRSDFCNSYIADGGLTTAEYAYYCNGVPLPQPVASGPNLSLTADAHTIMAYVKAPPHQYYFGPGPWSESIADMGTILSPMDVMGLQSYYGRPVAGSIKGYRGRALSALNGATGNSTRVVAGTAKNWSEFKWKTDAIESALSPQHWLSALELPGSIDAPNSALLLNTWWGGESQRPVGRLARWRAWGNMCLWAQSPTEGSQIVLDYCTATLGNPASRLYWNEHYQVGDYFRYQLAGTNLCAAVHVEGSNYTNGPLELRPCNSGNQWQLFMKNNVGQIVPRPIVASGRDACLNVLGGNHRPGEALGVWPCYLGAPSPNEQFFITEQLQFLGNDACMDMVNAETSLDSQGSSYATVGVNRCKGTADAFAWNSTQSWDVYGSGSLTNTSHPNLEAGTGPADLGYGLTGRVTKDFTIEMWVNPDAIQSTYANIIDFNHRANVGIVVQQNGNNTNQYTFGLGNGSTSSGITYQLQANRWQHIHFVRKGTSLYLYVDGALVQTQPCFAGDVYFLGNSAVTVGYNANYGRPFAGRYAGVRLWDQVHWPGSIGAGDPDATLSFNGSNDGLNLGNTLPIVTKGDFTIEMLVKPGATQQTYADILDFNHRANVGLVIQQEGNTTNRFTFAIGNGSTSAGVSAQLTADRWQSVAFQRRGADLLLYVDGTLTAQSTGFSGAISYIAGSNVTAGYNANYGRYFNGQLKDLRISKVAKVF